MRTKALLSMAALAAGALTSMAQSNVYSLNVVGYVNTTFPNGQYVLVSAPLDPGTNDLNSLIPLASSLSSILTWNASIQDYDATQPTYSTKKSTWVPDEQIPAGIGFFVLTGSADFTNTWVGNVRQGSMSTPINGGAGFDLIGSQVPMGGSLTTNVLAQYPGTSLDSILTWNVSLQDYDATQPTYSTKKSLWIPDDVGVKVGDAFFLTRNGGPISYTRNFTVQ